jgi:hypothetical protein
LPPVAKRASEKAAAVPTTTETMVLEDAMMSEFLMPSSPSRRWSAEPKWERVGSRGNQTGGCASRSSCGLNAVTSAQ